MGTLNKGHIDTDVARQLDSGKQISEKDLTHLSDAIRSWDQFLLKIFTIPVASKLTNDVLNQMSLEDTEHYLDVKIQLSHCLSAFQDAALEQKFDEMCGEIRKLTYHYTSTILPNLIDNSRSLIELAHKDDHHWSSGIVDMDWIHSPELEVSQEYKDCLVLQRKQLKSEIVRQHSKIKSQFSGLKKDIRESFNLIASEK